MIETNKKIRLSKKLSLGVGRNTDRFNFFKIGTGIFTILSLFLIGRVGWLLIHNQTDNISHPQVLGVKTEDSSDNNIYHDYTVKKGDTLFTISQDVKVEWSALATLNKLEPPFDLKPGQVLKIPKN